MKKFLWWIVFLCFLYTVYANVYIVFTTSKQIVNLVDLSGNNYDAIIVLGCKVNGDIPSMMLSRRLDKGMEVYNNTHSKIILSGDHGTKEYDEVNVMRDYMLENNVPEEDIFLDHAGVSTYDSIYRAKYIYGAKKIVIVSQKYHLYRSLYLAKELGIDAVGIMADDVPDTWVQIKNELREVLARDKNYIKGLLKPESKYLGEKISLEDSGTVTEG